MSEKIRKVGEVNYALNKIPLDYRCDHCNIHGVKLWREYQTIATATKLLCAHCAGKNQGEDVGQIDERGRIISKIAGRTDQIGNLLPAVPVEGDDTYWGYTSVPEDGVDWWKNLPNTLNNYEVSDLAELEAALSFYPLGITIKPILKAVNAAKELGMKFIPKAWITYIESGWRIVDRLGEFVWVKPLPSGSMSIVGLVKEMNLDIMRLLDTKRDFGSDIKNELRNYFPKKSDVGKIFYLQTEADFNEKKGKIVTREELLAIDPSEIRSWVEISEFDIIDVE